MYSENGMSVAQNQQAGLESAVILAGGKGMRFGSRDKGFLTYQGKSFIQRAISQAGDFKNIFISTNNIDNYKEFNLPLLEDRFRGGGPIGGIEAGLSQANSNWVYFFPVDLPLYTKEVSHYLSQFIASDYDAVLAVDHEGELRPLCGYYRKTCLERIQRAILHREFCIKTSLDDLRVKTVDLTGALFYNEKILFNVNKAEDLQSLPILVAVSGRRSTGKTTLICDLIPELVARKKRVATIKHTKHEYNFDAKGKDSYLHREAGAGASVIFSPTAYMISREGQPPDFVKLFLDFDVVLLEGFKDSEYPKLEVVREGAENPPMQNVIARVGGNSSDLLWFEKDEIKKIIDFLFNYHGGYL